MSVKKAANLEMQCLNMIASDLSSLGFHSSSKGYSYLCHTIFFAVQDCRLLSSIGSKIFPKVAELFETKPSTVERTCRHSLDAVYLEGGLKNINSLVGFNYIKPYEKPSLTNFISTISERNIARFNRLKMALKKRSLKKSLILKLNKLFKMVVPKFLAARYVTCPDISL